MSKFIKWFKSLFHMTPEEEFQDGLLWAREQLETGNMTMDEVSAFTYGSSDPFDKGAGQAVREYKQRPPKHINCRCSMNKVGNK